MPLLAREPANLCRAVGRYAHLYGRTVNHVLFIDRFYWQFASSQALPAQKVAIDDMCSGKGLVFTKNN